MATCGKDDGETQITAQDRMCAAALVGGLVGVFVRGWQAAFGAGVGTSIVVRGGEPDATALFDGGVAVLGSWFGTYLLTLTVLEG